MLEWLMFLSFSDVPLITAESDLFIASDEGI